MLDRVIFFGKLHGFASHIFVLLAHPLLKSIDLTASAQCRQTHLAAARTPPQTAHKAHQPAAFARVEASFLIHIQTLLGIQMTKIRFG